MGLRALALLLLALQMALVVSSEGDLDDLSFDNEEDGQLPSGQQKTEDRLELPTTEEEKKDLMRRVMTLAMSRPGARSRLGQVLPIIRQMSAPQRLALASLVMSQVMADPDSPSPELPKSSENSTAELLLPISMDIASMFKGLAREQPTGRSASTYRHELFYADSLRVPQRRAPPLNGINRRNANVHIVERVPTRGMPRRPLRKPIGGKTQTCSRVSNNLCVDSNDYPEEAIVKMILSDANSEKFKHFLTEPPIEGELEPELQRRKSDGTDNQKGHMCSSRVELARPKKARATSGQWKFIVNTKDYTQTLRLEICTRPQSRCNYLAESVDSQCVQVYNYHRLLTWDETAGLTMDVFKVPTCCSCRVLGYNGIPFPTGEKSTPSPDVDSNLVSSDDTPSVRVPQISHPHKPVRGYVPPKRESGGGGGGGGSGGRRPVVQHRGPPLPLEGEVPSREEPRYPPLDNSLRRITRNNTFDRSRFRPPLNTRHPALPLDNVNADTMSISSGAQPHAGDTAPPPRRINYSYHPIIDYFRPHHEGEGRKGARETARAESRVGHDWTPITGSEVAAR